MKNQKKTSGCNTFFLIWAAVSVVLGAIFSAINKTEQSAGSIVAASACIGFIIAFVIVAFRMVMLTGKASKEAKKGEQKYKQEAIPKNLNEKMSPVASPTHMQGKPLASQTIPLVENAVQRTTNVRQKQDMPVVNIVYQEVPQDANNELVIEIYAIPEEVKELLWIKGKVQTYNQNLLNEPSLIDLELEVRHDMNNLIQDIGYYPSYRNLKAENRYVYLSWLKDVTTSIPIGYVFIFYYGLERHLLFGKFEQAFEMIVKLRRFHNNSSFNAYSADALLIAALYHKRADLISKIDLNKATSKLAQFVIASLTGKIESDFLIENCSEVGFTNKRYINGDYDLFKQTLEEALQEKFGCTSYPIQEDDFLKCKGTFPLVLANYSLKMEERIANAPDLSTNEKYRKNAFGLLNEAHERVKVYKKKERAKDDSTDVGSNVLTEPKVIDLQSYADVQQEYDFLVSRVTYSKSPHEDIPFSFEEEVFFKALIKAMKENKLWEKEGLKLKRLANNTFNVDCKTCFIGKVKLRDKMFIQVQRGASGVKTCNVTDLVECLDKIPAWIRYIKYCKRN